MPSRWPELYLARESELIPSQTETRLNLLITGHLIIGIRKVPPWLLDLAWPGSMEYPYNASGDWLPTFLGVLGCVAVTLSAIMFCFR